MSKLFSNVTRGTVLASNVRVADNFFSRFAGLLFSPPLTAGEGLLLKPCNSIHMLGMKFPLDAVFFDAQWRVVGLLEGFAPGQISRFFSDAKSCLELECGAIASSGTQLGDECQVVDSMAL